MPKGAPPWFWSCSDGKQPAEMSAPKYITRFQEALLAVRVKRLSIEGCAPPVEGVHGILTTTKLQYSSEKWQLLGREHEYLFWLPGKEPLEISAQLYMNVSDHWKLFAYCKRGMLFSVNLTTMRERNDIVVLQEKLRLSTRSMSAEDREVAVEQLAEHLRRVGFDVSSDRRIVLGTFDGGAGRFVDTNARSFVRDFVVAAALKGHFMANKGYRLPGLKRVKVTGHVRGRGKHANQRAVPLALRFRVLERDHGRCVLCGATAASGARLHVDHVVPWSHGGRTEMENLQSLCERCNLGKGNRSTRLHRRAG